MLPAFLVAAGIPAFFAGLLMPIRHAGSLLPQLLTGGLIRRFPVRKWFWSCAALLQAVALIAIYFAAELLPARYAGPIVLLAVAVFSVASGVASIAYKDVLAKTIKRGRRGGLLAARASVGGALTLAAGGLIALGLGANGDSESDLLLFRALFAAAVVFWVVAAITFSCIREQPGATSGGKNMLVDIFGGLRFLQERDFQRFILARGLLLAIPLAVPFFILRSGASSGTSLSASAIGLPVVMLALAEIAANPLWGRLADRASSRAMTYGGALFVLCCAIPLFDGFASDFARDRLITPATFFLLGVAYAGVRLGRKTYIVDAAPDQYRSLFVAIGNTAIGLLTLILGGGGALLEYLVPGSAIAYFAALAVPGTIAAQYLAAPADFCRELK